MLYMNNHNYDVFTLRKRAITYLNSLIYPILYAAISRIFPFFFGTQQYAWNWCEISYAVFMIKIFMRNIDMIKRNGFLFVLCIYVLSCQKYDFDCLDTSEIDVEFFLPFGREVPFQSNHRNMNIKHIHTYFI